MTLRRGFKSEANYYAREFRTELGLELSAPLNPWKLAEHLAIPVVPLCEFAESIGPVCANWFAVSGTDFSAATVFDGTRRLIVHNDNHSLRRQASNIAHELAHGILCHPPTPPLNDHGCRNFDRVIEDEANWLGPALLISEEAALRIVKIRMPIEKACEHYGASAELINMRIGVTGARKRTG